MKYSIGIDIGGMTVKLGLVDNTGKLYQKKIFKTNTSPNENVVLIVEKVNELLAEYSLTLKDIQGIGIGCPGTINSSIGRVESWGNLNWEKVELVPMLKKYLNTNIKMVNDANLAILAEVNYGSAKNYKNAVMLTLGTGVGGGVVIDGDIYEGGEGMGTELGHVTLKVDGRKCKCGKKGCLEVYASATALMRQTKEAMRKNKDSLMWEKADFSLKNVDGRIPFECAKLGDETALKVVDNYVKYLSEGIMSFLNIFRPEAIIIGGGVSGAGEYLLSKIEKYCKKYYYGFKNTPKPDFYIATLGNDAGILGASCLFR